MTRERGVSARIRGVSARIRRVSVRIRADTPVRGVSANGADVRVPTNFPNFDLLYLPSYPTHDNKPDGSEILTTMPFQIRNIM